MKKGKLKKRKNTKKKENNKYKERKWWKKCKEIKRSLFMMRMKKGEKEKESSRRARRPKARQTLGQFGKWLFLFVLLGQNWLSVSAAVEGPQRTEAVIKMQQEVRNKESRWMETAPKRWKAAEWGRQDGNEERGKTIEVHHAQWVDVEYREKVHEKIQWKV